MRFKLDENLPLQLQRLLAESGHDAVTVLDQGMGGAADSDLASACLLERRVLLTQDIDFADLDCGKFTDPNQGVTRHHPH